MCCIASKRNLIREFLYFYYELTYLLLYSYTNIYTFKYIYIYFYITNLQKNYYSFMITSPMPSYSFDTLVLLQWYVVVDCALACISDSESDLRTFVFECVGGERSGVNV